MRELKNFLGAFQFKRAIHYCIDAPCTDIALDVGRNRQRRSPFGPQLQLRQTVWSSGREKGRDGGKEGRKERRKKERQEGRLISGLLSSNNIYPGNMHRRDS
jgi:hypothetical protein